MKLNLTSAMITAGVLWGALMVLMGAANCLWPSYGGAFLEVMASIYPGYEVGTGWGQVALGGLFGLVDGVLGGAILAGVYNGFLPKEGPRPS